ANVLTMYTDAGDYLVIDAGAVIAAGSGCSRVDDHQARCSGAGIDNRTIDLGDLNDMVLELDGLAPAALAGGPGDDVLNGTPADDVISGDDGNDVLNGNFGSDVLNGGSGDDVMDGRGGPPVSTFESPDTFNG